MDLIDKTKLSLKIGDKVTYTRDNKIHTIVGYFFIKGFNNYDCGYGYVIDNVSVTLSCGTLIHGYDKEGRQLNLNTKNIRYVFEENIKLITDENMKEFTKKDLKTGMIVELNNQERYLVLNDVLLGSLDRIYLSHYENNLKYKIKYFDLNSINKVYSMNTSSWGEGFERTLRNVDEYSTLIWERPKVVELSMEEIANKLGIPVNQLRIKNNI